MPLTLRIIQQCWLRRDYFESGASVPVWCVLNFSIFAHLKFVVKTKIWQFPSSSFEFNAAVLLPRHLKLELVVVCVLFCCARVGWSHVTTPTRCCFCARFELNWVFFLTAELQRSTFRHDNLYEHAHLLYAGLLKVGQQDGVNIWRCF